MSFIREVMLQREPHKVLCLYTETKSLSTLLLYTRIDTFTPGVVHLHFWSVHLHVPQRFEIEVASSLVTLGMKNSTTAESLSHLLKKTNKHGWNVKLCFFFQKKMHLHLLWKRGSFLLDNLENRKLCQYNVKFTGGYKTNIRNTKPLACVCAAVFLSHHAH